MTRRETATRRADPIRLKASAPPEVRLAAAASVTTFRPSRVAKSGTMTTLPQARGRASTGGVSGAVTAEPGLDTSDHAGERADDLDDARADDHDEHDRQDAQDEREKDLDRNLGRRLLRALAPLQPHLRGLLPQ